MANEAEKRGQRIVIFTTRRGRYMTGERAAFPNAQADELVAQGAARYADKMMRRRTA